MAYMYAIWSLNTQQQAGSFQYFASNCGNSCVNVTSVLPVPPLCFDLENNHPVDGIHVYLHALWSCARPVDTARHLSPAHPTRLRRCRSGAQMEQFAEQASTNWIMSAFIYTLGALAVILVLIGLVFIDIGMVRKRNVLDTVVQKVGGAMVGGLGTLVIGYPIWQWQFNSAFGVPAPLW